MPAVHPRGQTGRTAFPAGGQFAFTILDDTDDATVENVEPIYELLFELGFRTTKTAWPLDCPEGSELYFAAETLQDARYLAFIRGLAGRGFEIAFHGATMESSVRERTLEGLRFLEEELGVPLKIHCNHGQNRENLYWGSNRYRTLFLRWPLALVERLSGRPRFAGHDRRSPYFWGDVCRERIRFVRNFAFATLNTVEIPPHAPYRLRSTPYVNYWFNSSDAPDATHFKRLVTPASLSRLHRERGVCILSTHLGKGFVRNGRVDPQVEDTLRFLATLPGWFAPVSEVLEHLLATRAAGELAPWTRWRLEFGHLVDRLHSHLLRPRNEVLAR